MALIWLTCSHCKTRYEADNLGRTSQPIVCPSCVSSRPAKAEAESVPSQWYYVNNRQKVGPVGLSQLQELVIAGQLKTSDMLLPVGASRWVTAETIEPLFQANPQTVEALWPASIPPSQTVDDPGKASGETTDFYTRPASSPSELPNLAGYRVVGILGRGGMGIVYRAENLALKRPVALKMILARGYAGEQEQQRFLVEAESVARLRHPNIVQIHEVGEHEGWPFLALEFVEGGSLASQLQGNPWPLDRAAHLVHQLAMAMQHAHDAGIVHRDLKPANVLLTADGTPKITDFGLAKKLDDASGLTQTGAVMGTPSYMAPEQAEGRVREVGPLADVYALGAVLYELLTGRPPFKAAGVMETLDLVRTQEPVSPRLLNPTVPRDLETICLKCLNKDGPRRYIHAAALAEDLRRFRAGEPIAARPVGNLERAVKWTRRNPAVASLMAAVVFSLILGITVASYFAYQANENAKREKLKAEEAQRETDRADGETKRANDKTAEAIKLAVLAEDESKKEKAARKDAEFQTLRVENALHAVQLDQAFRAWQQYDIPETERILGEVEPRFQQNWETRFIRQLIPRRSRELLGHTEVVNAVAVSTDGQRVISGGDDKTLRLWDAESGQVLRLFNGHTGEITAVALSIDDRRLVSASKDKTIKLWDVETGQEIRSFQGHTMPVTSVALSLDGKRIASGGFDKTVRLWETETGKEIHRCLGHTLPIISVAISDDGKTFASSSWDGTSRIWDTENGKEKTLLKGRTSPSIAFTRDGKQVIATEDIEKRIPGGLPGAFRSIRSIGFADVETGAINAAIEFQPNVGTFALSRDRKRLILGTQDPDNALHLFELESGRELQVLRGHGQRITSIAISGDGKRIVSGAAERAVKVWDLEAPPEKRSFVPSKLTHYLALSDDGKRLVTANADNSLTLWDAETGKALRTFPGHTKYVLSLAIDGKGERVLSSGQDNTFVLRDATTGLPIRVFRGYVGNVIYAHLSKDGKRACSVSMDKTFRIWDAESGQQVSSHEWKTCNSMAFSRDGKRYVSGVGDGHLTVWNAETGEKVRTFKTAKKLLFVPVNPRAVAMSDDGRHVVSMIDPQTVGVWEADTGREIHELRGHTKPVNSVVISADNRYILSAGSDKTVRLWDMETGQGKLVLGSGLKEYQRVLFSAAGQRIVSLGGDQVVRFWEAEADPERFAVLENNPVLSLSISPKGRRIVLAGGDQRTVKIRDAKTGREVRTLRGHTLSVNEVTVSGDDRRVVSGGDDKTLKVWDMESGQEIQTLGGIQGRIQRVAITRDGKHVLALDEANRTFTVRKWNTETGQEILAFTGKETSVYRIALSDDGRSIATGNSDKSIRVLDAEDGREIHRLTGHTDDISSLAFSGDGSSLASASRDKTVKVWDVATGKEKFTLEGHGDIVYSVAFSRDGNRIASGSQDRTIKIWDAQAGREVRTLRGHKLGVHTIALSEDGSHVVSGGFDHTLRVWDIGPVKSGE